MGRNFAEPVCAIAFTDDNKKKAILLRVAFLLYKLAGGEYIINTIHLVLPE